MNDLIKKRLIELAKKKILENDSSHDIDHAFRVLSIAQTLAKDENADLEIVIPAAIFHDVICYPKNHKNRHNSSIESALFAKEALEKDKDYPSEKIDLVYQSIINCSFSKGTTVDFIEGKILQDADSLEATGAISIMRTFASAGSMNMSFYNTLDPFCVNRLPDNSKYALDLFYTRLLVIKDRLHTKAAKEIAEQRTAFLLLFLDQLKKELVQNNL